MDFGELTFRRIPLNSGEGPLIFLVSGGPFPTKSFLRAELYFLRRERPSPVFPVGLPGIVGAWPECHWSRKVLAGFQVRDNGD